MAYNGESETINEILNAPDKLVMRAENFLSKMFRQMLYELNIGPKLFRHKVQAYLDNPENGVSQDPTQKQNHRGNLMKELSHPRMSWAVFEKALRVIDCANVVIDLYATNGSTGTITRHQAVIKNYDVGSNQIEDFSKANVVEAIPLVDKEKTPEPDEAHAKSAVAAEAERLRAKFAKAKKA